MYKTNTNNVVPKVKLHPFYPISATDIVLVFCKGEQFQTKYQVQRCVGDVLTLCVCTNVTCNDIPSMDENALLLMIAETWKSLQIH